MNTKELFEGQDEMEDIAADSKIMLFSPVKEVLQVWKHCGIDQWSPLQDLMWTLIPSNQNLLLVAQLVPYTQMYSRCGTGLHKLIQQDLQQKKTLCLICHSVL
jgi:hypothetical protein